MCLGKGLYYLFLFIHCNVLCSVYAEMLNRCQDQLQLAIFDVDCFVTVEDSTDAVMQDVDDSLSVPGSAWIIREEMSKYWVNVSIFSYIYDLASFVHRLLQPRTYTLYILDGIPALT